MSEFDSEILAVVAYAEVHVVAGQPPTATYTMNRGFTPTITVNGAGDYTHTLEPGRALDDNVMGVFVSSKAVPPLVMSAEHQSNSQIRVRAIDVIYGVGAVGDYYLKVIRVTNTFT